MTSGLPVLLDSVKEMPRTHESLINGDPQRDALRTIEKIPHLGNSQPQWVGLSEFAAKLFQMAKSGDLIANNEPPEQLEAA
jgi:hypothetical protein